jgi:hypothetical protein
MPVNAPIRSSRAESQTGEVVEIVNENIVRVQMDGHGLKVVWMADTLTEA